MEEIPVSMSCQTLEWAIKGICRASLSWHLQAQEWII